MVCWFCGSDNDDKRVTCSHCYADLRDRSQPGIKSGEVSDHHTGSPLPAEANSESLDSAQEQQTPASETIAFGIVPPAPPRRRVWLWAACTVVILLTIIGIGVGRSRSPAPERASTEGTPKVSPGQYFEAPTAPQPTQRTANAQPSATGTTSARPPQSPGGAHPTNQRQPRETGLTLLRSWQGSAQLLTPDFSTELFSVEAPWLVAWQAVPRMQAAAEVAPGISMPSFGAFSVTVAKEGYDANPAMPFADPNATNVAFQLAVPGQQWLPSGSKRIYHPDGNCYIRIDATSCDWEVAVYRIEMER